MCIIFLAIDIHPKYSLVLASNRDEFLDRPTEAMSIWTNDGNDGHFTNESREGRHCSEVNDNDNDASSSLKAHKKRHSKRTSLAGKDLVGGGTWLGIDVTDRDLIVEKNAVPDDHPTYGSHDLVDNDDNSLRWIALTNFIDANTEEIHGKASRGSLLSEYLGMNTTNPSRGGKDGSSAKSFAVELTQRGEEYNGFSMLVGDKTGVYYCTNRGIYPSPSSADQTPMHESSHSGPLPRGIYGLSNGILDSHWPKVMRGKEMLTDLCNKDASTPVKDFHESLMEILRDEWRPPDKHLPDSHRSFIFVPQFEFMGREYGTRCSTTILVERSNGKVSVLERTWTTGNDRWFEFGARRMGKRKDDSRETR
ncbi:hypothetical protein HJC23_000839 [Cyclotella cryptica]|uniref:DUF833-domain-containing protein n=1 Tax=Cyclotella cryptica TaxID=29204 RepID=A0ABD3P003_9STRA